MSRIDSNTDITIAVIGKSAAGKSAFIKSFSNQPDTINSEGDGQTTRSYAEYKFLISKREENARAYIKLMTRNEFVDKRVIQTIEKLKKVDEDLNEITFKWIKEQYCDEDYKEEMRKKVLYSNDFFNINEFTFLNNGESVEKIEILYNCFVELLSKFGENSYIENSAYNNIEIVHKIVEINDQYKSNQKNENEEIVIEKAFQEFFQQVYIILLDAIKETFKNNSIYIEENGVSFFQFNITEENRNILELFLKVIDDGINNKKSYTSLVSKVKIVSGICDDYSEVLKKYNINSITLIDTYGLDHQEQTSDKVLKERYHKIFSVDYPDISTVFFIEPLHKSASNDFIKAIKTLYSQRPDIMTYIIATYIDEHDIEYLQENSTWLNASDKSISNIPKLNGKVIDFLYNSNEILTVLKRNDVSRTLAEKRLEVMKKRFGPFCGKIKSGDKQFYEKINNATIESIFFSILNREHLGDGYIEINKIFDKLEKASVFNNILRYMVDRATERFQQIFELSASRTRGSIRENLESGILGFNGSTIDATWLRVFNDAYNQTFSKVININNDKITLSQVFELEGNEKIAFDELINMFFPYLFMRFCNEGQPLVLWQREISCTLCSIKGKFQENCIWGQFINSAGYDNFYTRSNYNRVIDWLLRLHDFSEICSDEFYSKLEVIFKERIERELIPMCREHNARIASKYIKVGKESYLDIKRKIVLEYKEKYDKNVNEKEFYQIINGYM